MMDASKLKPLKDFDRVDLGYLKGKYDPELVLEELGLDVAFQVGDWLMCSCLFKDNHKNGDRNPSFGFDVEKQAYSCFVCGGGSLLSLIKDSLGMDDKQAEQWLIDRSGVTHTQKKITKKVDNKVIPTEYPDSILNNFRKIHPYLYERGISKDVIVKMRIGYDEAHDGITIPLFVHGKLLGWQTRHLGDCRVCSDKWDNVPKYINTIGLPKKVNLYNIDNATQTNNKIIVVESPMTVLKLMSLGIENVVATFGSWSYDQMLSLSGCPGVILWPDADSAGQKNAARVLSFSTKLYPVQIVPVVGELKDSNGSDAADLDLDEIYEYLDEAYSPLVFKKYGLLSLKDRELLDA